MSDAQQIFDSFLDRLDAVPGELRFEDLLVSHPKQRQELIRLHEAWLRLQSFAGSVRSQFGVTSFHRGSDDPIHIPGYRITREIGRGGMGTVYEAEQAHPRRSVALKVITGGFLAEQSVKRMQQEAQLLALLQHPGIAQIIESGQFESETGVWPFYAMELIGGDNLLDYAVKHGLTTADRLELLVKICEAVQHAHDRGVIHRDLKPANILVDSSGQPKVLDFGVARVTNADLRVVSVHTDVGQLVGTIPYMSPEQASGDPERLDARSDLYSLGVVAYELLTGEMPYGTRGVRVHEAIRVVCEEEPRPLSGVHRALKGDVETILGKALEKEVARRYLSAAELAADLQRHREHRPILARPASRIYRLKKFSRRHTGLVVGLALSFAILALGFAGTLLGFLEAQSQRDEVAEEAARANRTAEFLHEILTGISPAVAQGMDTELLRLILDRATLRVDRELGEHPEVEAAIRESLGDAYHAISAYQDAEVHFLRAQALLRENAPSPTGSTLLLSAKIASNAARLGRLREAVQRLEDLRDRALDFNSEPQWIDRILGHLGIAYLESARLEEASRILEPLVQQRQRVLGADHPRTLIAMNSLGLCRLGQQRYEEARALLEQTLSRRRRIDGDTHPDTLVAMHNLGGLLIETGQYDAAERLLIETCARNRTVLGEDHRATLVPTVQLAYIYTHQGRLQAAEELCRDALNRLSRVLGPGHFEVLEAEECLSFILRRQRRTTEAINLLEQVHRIRKKTLGLRHTRTLICSIRLASAYQEMGRLDESEALKTEILDDVLEVLGARHVETLTLQNDLGVLYTHRNRWAEAESTLRAVLEVRRDVLGEQHPDTITTQLSLGVLYHASGRIEAGVEFLGKSLAAYRRIYGDEMPLTRDTARRMLECSKQLQTPGPLEPQLRELVEHLDHVSQEKTPAVRRLRVLWGQALVANGELQEAVELFEAILDQDSSELGPSDPRIAVPSGLLGIALARRGDLEDAVPLLTQSFEDLPAEHRLRSTLAQTLADLYTDLEETDEATHWRERMQSSDSRDR
jgi:tetratricopeptide (TPR) repeat protein